MEKYRSSTNTVIQTIDSDLDLGFNLYTMPTICYKMF